MNPENNHINTLIPHLFRQEYVKLTAVLSSRFGLQHIEIAEDIASDTFLKAIEHWSLYCVPDNPQAWLYTVAKNKAKDYLKRHQHFETRIQDEIKPKEPVSDEEFEFTEEVIADSLLSMIFVVCNPVNPPSAQICLALQILCGFSVDEIANAFLTKHETIKKRLQRARDNFRTGDFQLRKLSKDAINERLDIVLKTLYLLFNEGYFSQNEDKFIRKDLCSEAMRLTLLLVEDSLTNTSQANALLALMCFQSSRLQARMNENGEAILFEEQDQSLWDEYLINKGNYYLMSAFGKSEISKYHLEASIAYWHSTQHEKKWQHILQLYNRLLVMEYSPVAALNRAFAFAKVYGNKMAIEEVAKLNLSNNSYYHGLMGYLYSGINHEQALFHYGQALQFTKSAVEKKVLTGKIDKLKK